MCSCCGLNTWRSRLESFSAAQQKVVVDWLGCLGFVAWVCFLKLGRYVDILFREGRFGCGGSGEGLQILRLARFAFCFKVVFDRLGRRGFTLGV